MNGIRKNYYWGSIRFAMGTPANAGDFEKSIIRTRQKKPMNPDGHLLASSAAIIPVDVFIEWCTHMKDQSV
jgi:hypothetical protein